MVMIIYIHIHHSLIYTTVFAFLCWGGEPGSDCCYAFLTLFFEVDPASIDSPEFDEKVSRNLRAIINIAEKDIMRLSTHRKYKPQVLRAIFP